FFGSQLFFEVSGGRILETRRKPPKALVIARARAESHAVERVRDRVNGVARRCLKSAGRFGLRRKQCAQFPGQPVATRRGDQSNARSARFEKFATRHLHGQNLNQADSQGPALVELPALASPALFSLRAPPG